MKSSILLAIVMITLSGCHGNKPSENTLTTNGRDTSARCKGGLYDSIQDIRLQGEVCKDGIEILAVRHATSQGEPVEQLLYLDRSAARLEPFKTNAQGFGPMAFDSTVLRHNPLPAINGNYVQVFSYQGKYVMANVGDVTNSDIMVVTDSAVIWIPNGLNAFLYKSGEQSGDRVTYIVSDQQRNKVDTIHIRLLGGENKMQLWHWSHEIGAGYSLMMPLERLGAIPELNAINNRGLDGDMEVAFDKLNFDSLMNSR